MPEEADKSGGGSQEDKNHDILPAPSSKPLDPKDVVQIDKETISRVAVAIINTLGSAPPSRKSKQYPNAFVIDEELLKNLDGRARECLATTEAFPGSQLTFDATLGMSDLSKQSFSDFDRFLKRAGDKRDPERLELFWHQRIAFPFAADLRIEAAFVTEKRLETQELGLFDYNWAYMELSVFGQSDDWVERTFDDLEPILINAKLSHLYAPLLLFRNKYVVQMLSNTIALSTMLITITLVGRTLGKNSTLSKEKIIDTIISLQDIGQKVDALSRAIFNPDVSPWWEPFISLLSGVVAYVVVLTLCLLLLPKLTPKSCIAVGLAKIRYVRYENAFKFIVFTVGIGGILIPIIKALFGM